jgi:aconitate decarboxylase
MGNAAGRGLEAAQLAWMGLEGNPDVLDLESGFGVFFNEYNPSALADVGGFEWALESQSVAVKSFPAHLGMHWVAEAALAAKAELRSGGESSNNTNHLDQVRSVTLRVPASKYINRTCPSSEHQARHSFQFNACSALLDGEVTVQSFSDRTPPWLLLHSSTRASASRCQEGQPPEMCCNTWNGGPSNRGH